MKSKISIVVTFVFIFVSSASFSQYKYDIGLRASTNGLERFQLDFRYHFDSPYSLLFSVGSGSDGSYQYTQTPVYNDSLILTSMNSQNNSNLVFKAGVQRKLGFLATDYFYAGAHIGFGFEQRQYGNGSVIYSVATDSMENVINPIWEPWEYQSEDYSSHSIRAINAQLGVSFGVDVPIYKRFSVNAEIGFVGIYQQLLEQSTSIITLFPTASGGIRYSFGKRHEGTQGNPN